MAEVTIRVFNAINPEGGEGVGYTDLDVDLTNPNIKLDISALERGTIGEVFALGSQGFTLPGTQTNNEFFSFSDEVSSTTAYLALKKVFRAQILLDGNRISDGFLYFDSTITNNRGEQLYNCTFSDSVPSLSDIFGDLKLGDLDWSEYDHLYNLTNITASWDNDLFGGDIIYPTVNYGYSPGYTPFYDWSYSEDNSIFEDEDAAVPYLAHKPAIRVPKVIDKIFSSVDFNYSSSFFTDEVFNVDGVTCDDLYLLTTPNDRTGITDIANQYLELSMSISQSFPSTDQTVTLGNGGFITGFYYGSELYLNDGLVDTEVSDLLDLYDPATGIITAPFNGEYQLQITFNNDWSSLTPPGFLDTGLREGIVLVVVNDVITDDYQIFTFSPTTSAFDLNRNINLNAGDEVKILIRTNQRTFNDGNVPTDWNVSDFNLKLEIDEYIPDVTIMDEQFGDIKVVDFLKGLQEQFNLLFFTDKNSTNVIQIESYNDWINQGNLIDWTDKVDYSKKWEITHPAAGNERVLNFTNKEDKNDFPLTAQREFYGQEFGSFRYFSDSDYAEGEKVIGDKIFAPTVVEPIKNSPTLGQPMIIPHIYKVDNDGSRVPFKFAPRLLFNLGKKQMIDGFGSQYKLRDIDGTIVSTNDYLQTAPVSALDADLDKFDLNFGNQLFGWPSDAAAYSDHYTQNTPLNIFWANYINQIYRPEARKVKLNIAFKPTDLFDFNLNDTIFIAGQEYLIDNISGFDTIKPQSTQVTLIKKISPTINQLIYSLGGNISGDYPDVISGGDFNGVEFIFSASAGGVITPKDTNTGAELSSSLIPRNIVESNGYGFNVSGSILGNINRTRGTYMDKTPTNYRTGNQSYDFSTSGDNLITGKYNVAGPNSTNIQIVGKNNTVASSTKNVNVVGQGNVVGEQTTKSIVIASGSNIGSFNENIYNLGLDYLEISGSQTKDVLVFGSETLPGVSKPQSFDLQNITGVGIMNNHSITLSAKSGSQQLYLLNNEDINVENVDRTVLINNKAVDAEGGGNSSTHQTLINNRGFKLPQTKHGSVFINNQKSGSVSELDVFEISGSNFSTFIGHTPDINPDKFDNDYTVDSYNNSTVLGKTQILGSEYAGFNKVSLNRGASYQIGEYENVILITHNKDASGAITLTLPDISSNKMDGRKIQIKANNSINATFTCNVDGFGTQTIDGSLSFTLNTTYQWVKLIAISGSWYVIS